MQARQQRCRTVPAYMVAPDRQRRLLPPPSLLHPGEQAQRLGDASRVAVVTFMLQPADLEGEEDR